jgi:hypothetical protein
VLSMRRLPVSDRQHTAERSVRRSSTVAFQPIADNMGLVESTVVAIEMASTPPVTTAASSVRQGTTQPSRPTIGPRCERMSTIVNTSVACNLLISDGHNN